MSYRITYGKQPRKYTRRHFSHKKAIICAACAIILLISLHLSGIGAAIWRFLLPGDPAVTEAALFGIIENLRSGADLSDTVTVFCKEILNGAK